MNSARLVTISAVLLLFGIQGAAEQGVRSDTVLVRDSHNRLFVSTVLAGPGDTIAISDREIIVNGRSTGVRVQVRVDWSTRRIEAGAFFVAGDPAGLGTDARAWGLIPESRLVGTVQIGALPAR